MTIDKRERAYAQFLWASASGLLWTQTP